MRLTFPKSYTPQELSGLYDEYRAANPELYTEWVNIERKGRDIGQDDLHDVQKSVYAFLDQRFEWDNHLALSEVFADFRRLLVQENFKYRLGPQGN